MVGLRNLCGGGVRVTGLGCVGRRHRNRPRGQHEQFAAHALTGYGAVHYAYNIGTYEVTAGQYCEFLNAVAATDSHELYNSNMWSNTYGCKIQRSGSLGSYTYSVDVNWANRPVNYVSWGDAARFANWLHNGQPTGPQDADDDRGRSLLPQRRREPCRADGRQPRGELEVGDHDRG